MIFQSKQENASINISRLLWLGIPATLLLGIFSYLVFKYHALVSFDSIISNLNQEFFIYLMIGIFAQLVDSMLGMGYGATSTSFLLSFGVSPAVSSTSVHVAEMFTTGASAISHYKFKNINKKLVHLQWYKGKQILIRKILLGE